MIKNQPIRLTELAKIRALDDLDLVLLIKVISGNGWPWTRKNILREGAMQAQGMHQLKETIRPILQWVHKETHRTLRDDLGTSAEIAKIRILADFDLRMLISDIHDFGWDVARNTLLLMPPDPDNDAWNEGMRRARAEGRIGVEWEKKQAAET